MAVTKKLLMYQATDLLIWSYYLNLSLRFVVNNVATQVLFSKTTNMKERVVFPISEHNVKVVGRYTAISIKVVPEQSGKVEYKRERLLGIANKLMNSLAIPSSLSRSYSTFLLCSGTTLIEIAVYISHF